MSSLITDDILLNVPSGSSLDGRISGINVQRLECTDLEVGGTLNSQTISGSFVLTEGAQVINGAKTFTSIVTSGTSVDSISELTPGNGVVVDSVRLREDTIVSPAMTLASLSAAGAATNISMAVRPKGNGSIIAAIPDNDSVGGWSRGEHAVDFQTDRSLAGMVAAGNNSVICGGQDNSALGNFSAVCGGSGNRATGNYSVAAGSTAWALHDGSQVYASTGGAFQSTDTDQFSARFTNGYRLIGGGLSLNDRVVYYTDSTLQTPDATPAALFTLHTPAGRACLYTAKIIATEAAGGLAVYVTTVKAKNIIGTLTIGAEFNSWADIDPALSTADIRFAVSGQNVVVEVTGITGDVNWSGCVEEVRHTI